MTNPETLAAIAPSALAGVCGGEEPGAAPQPKQEPSLWSQAATETKNFSGGFASGLLGGMEMRREDLLWGDPESKWTKRGAETGAMGSLFTGGRMPRRP